MEGLWGNHDPYAPVLKELPHFCFSYYYRSQTIFTQGCKYSCRTVSKKIYVRNETYTRISRHIQKPICSRKRNPVYRHCSFSNRFAIRVVYGKILDDWAKTLFQRRVLMLQELRTPLQACLLLDTFSQAPVARWFQTGYIFDLTCAYDTPATN